MITLERSNIIRELNEEKGYLHQKWLGHAKSSEWYEIQVNLLETVIKYKIRKVISDTRKLPVVSKGDTDWMAEKITPELAKNGLSHVAIIVPDNAFTQMAIDIYKEEAEKFIIFKFFKTFDEAEDWILQID